MSCYYLLHWDANVKLPTFCLQDDGDGQTNEMDESNMNSDGQMEGTNEADTDSSFMVNMDNNN